MATSNEEQSILDIKVRYEDAINGIVKYKQKIEELKEAQKKLKDEVKAGTITQEEANKTTAAIDEQVKEYKNTVRELSKEVQNNLKTEKEKEGSLRQLRAELSNLTKQYDSLSEAERKSAKGQELKKHINDITDNLKKAEEETQRYYRNVGNYENSIKSALGLNNEFANSILSMTAGGKGFNGIIDGVTTKIKAFGSTLMGLVSNPYFLALAGIAGAGAAFKWWYDYNEGLVKASKLTSSFTGMHGNEMKAYRNEIQAVSDAFGQDFSETLKTVNALVQNYGISWEDALTKVKDGLLMGGSILPEYSQYIQQYAGAFKDLGINANQLVGVMTQIGKSGINANTALQSINRGGYNLQKMSSSLRVDLKAAGIDADDLSKRIQSGQTTTIAAMQEVTKKLEQQGVTSQNTAVVMQDLFGKGAINLGSQFLKVLNNIGTGIDQIKGKASETQKIRDETIKKQAELNSTVSAMFDMTGGGFEKMKAQMKYIAVNSLLSIAKAVVNVINYFIDWYNESLIIRGIIQAIITDFNMAWNTIKMVFNLIIDAAKSVGRQLKGLADIVEGIVTLSWDKIKSGFSQLGSNFLKTFKEGMGDVKAYGMAQGKALLDAINNTIKGAKVEHIKVPVAFSSTGNGGEKAVTAQNGGGSVVNNSTTNNGKSGKSGKNNSTSEAELSQKELAEVRKAEDLLTQLVVQTAEERRKQIIDTYDRQIEDVKVRLTTEKNLTVTARKAMNTQIIELEAIKQKKLKEFDESVSEEEIKRRQTVIENELSAVKKGSEEEYKLKIQKIKNAYQLEMDAANREVMSEEEKQALLTSINDKYYAQETKAYEDYHNGLLQKQKEAIEKELKAKEDQAMADYYNGDATEAPEVTKARLEMEAAQQIYETAQQQEGESYQDFLNRKNQLFVNYSEKQKAYSDAMIADEKGKFQVLGDLVTAASNVLEAFGSKSKTLTVASKVLALAQIAIDTGVALAAGIKQAQSVPFPANIAAIATTVTTILANIATAVKTVKSAKFAEGGDVTGPGTGTSDSVPAKLSNGESVLTAQATSMFAPALSAFNQMGGGVPIYGGNVNQQIGEEFLARAVARGFAAAPRPVVSVEEIDNTQNRVETLERIASIK